MSRPLALALVCVLLLGTVTVGGAFATPIDDSSTIGTPDQFTSATFNVEVYANGSARWTFSYYTPTLNDSQQSQFLTYAERFESQESDLWTNFRARADVLTQAGSDATGRNMSARAFERDASLDQVGNRGVVEMSFRWTEFGAVEGDRVVVGDVFEGMFYITDDQWLVFETGPQLQFVPDAIDPDPDEFSDSTIVASNSITWTGERQFTDGHPRVVFTTQEQSAGATEQLAQQPTEQVEPTSVRAGGSGGGSGSIVLFGLVVLLVVLGVGVAWRSGLFESESTAPDDSAGDAVASSDDAEGEPDATADASTPDGAAGATGSAIDDADLLTDEDRVLTLLQENGGRMKQANIVDETGWSKSKVSMLLSDMADDEQISKLRVGRENIISLRGHEPDAAGSPFDDE